MYVEFEISGQTDPPTCSETDIRANRQSVKIRNVIKDLSKLRAEFPEYAARKAQSEQVTPQRLKRAFQAFF